VVEVTETSAGWRVGWTVGRVGKELVGVGAGRQSLVSGVRDHEVLKVGDAGSELVLRHGGRLFSGEGK
jgi:hypothetical protein